MTASPSPLVAFAQYEAHAYDKEANLATIEEVVARASVRGASGIVFPEMQLTGYMVWDRLEELAEPLDGPSVTRLRSVARAEKVVLVCGLPERDEQGRLWNSAVVIDADGSLVGAHRKVHLFADEGRFFEPGEEVRTFATAIGRLGVMICYDLEFPELSRMLAMAGAETLVVATANMEPYAAYQDVFVRARAMENGVHVGLANTVGDDGTYRYFGGSCLVAPDGEVVSEAVQGSGLVFGTIQRHLVPPADPNLRYLERRRPDLYGPIAPGDGAGGQIPASIAPRAGGR